MFKFETYKKRSIKFLEQADIEGWRIKIYGITADSNNLPAKIIIEGKNAVIPNLPIPAVTEQRFGIGFLIIHRGIMANWFLLNWWENEDIIHQQVFSSPINAPGKIRPVTDKSIMACVYELEVYSFERDAWINTVLSDVNGQDFEEYLRKRLNT